MKFSAILLLSALLITSCKTLDKLTTFELKYEESFTVPATTVVNIPLDILTPDIATNSESTFSSNDTRKDLIEEINLTNLTLTVIDPAGKSLKFLKTIEIYISADGLSEVLIAEKQDIPETVGSTLDLDVTNADLAEYIKQDAYSLRVKVVTDEAITEAVEIRYNATFLVNAKILGV